jgi:hypothetical protein
MAREENALKKLFENPDEEAEAEFRPRAVSKDEAGNAYNETFLPNHTGNYTVLCPAPLSGRSTQGSLS